MRPLARFVLVPWINRNYLSAMEHGKMRLGQILLGISCEFGHTLDRGQTCRGREAGRQAFNSPECREPEGVSLDQLAVIQREYSRSSAKSLQWLDGESELRRSMLITFRHTSELA